MKAPVGLGGTAGSASLAPAGTIVLLVILIGATIFLWRNRFMRRRTAQITIAVLLVLLVATAAWVYTNPM
jgi:O-antigen ligase